MSTVPAIPPGHLEARRDPDAIQRWHRFAFEILPMPFGNGRLLDVGCGGGGVAVRCAEKGWDVTGIDIAPRNVEALRTLGHRAEIVDLNGPFPFGAGAFACVTFIEVAEHLVLAERAFAEIARVLGPGGKAVFSTPNNASYRRRIKALKGKAPDDEGYHFRFFVKDRLEDMLRRAGLRVETRNSYGYIPFVDTITLYKARTGKRRNYPIGARWESLLADRFVWRLARD